MSIKLCYTLHENYWDKVIFWGYYPIETKARNILKLHSYCVHFMHKLKEPHKEKDFITPDGLHASFGSTLMDT